MKVRKHLLPGGGVAYEWLEWTDADWLRHKALGSGSAAALEAEGSVTETVDAVRGDHNNEWDQHR